MASTGRAESTRGARQPAVAEAPLALDNAQLAGAPAVVRIDERKKQLGIDPRPRRLPENLEVALRETEPLTSISATERAKNSTEIAIRLPLRREL